MVEDPNMLAKTGLLIISNPSQIGKTLSAIDKRINKTLYIELLSALNDSYGGGFYPNIFTSWPKYSKTIYNIYSQAANHCQNVDVRVLLSNIKYNKLKIQTGNPVDVVIFDRKHPQNEIESFVKTRISNIAQNYDVITLESDVFKNPYLDSNLNETTCDHTVLGGTFDRLHIAHKLLLSEAALRAKGKITVGVTEENMLQTKVLWELIEDIDTRLNNVKDFLNDVCPELDINVVPISDPFGPAIVDPSMQLIVVSAETIRGAEKINEIRESKGLNKLEIIPLELVNEPFRQAIEEAKISSSTSRLRLLGTLIKPVVPNTDIPSTPYVIGLTGGIASGKSNVATSLMELGAQVIDCDKVAHKLYEPGKPCHQLIVSHFGQQVLSDSGEINRKVLGGIVFKNPEELKKLNSIIWPAIAEEVNNIIRTSDKEVVAIEAAILLPAGWDKFCHEIWATVVPSNEAAKRLITRNSLTEEQAASRLSSQPPNSTYVRAAHVVFCTLWEYDYTRQQVEKAWSMLKKRINNSTVDKDVNATS